MKIIMTLIGIYLVTFSHLYAQDTTSILPKDPLALKDAQVRNNILDFLISDTLYYNFFISSIYKVKNGYFILLRTKADNFQIYASLITAKEKGIGIRKIKKGEVLPMKLMRYFETPLLAAIPFTPVYDVMLGKKTMNILSSGAFNYLFTTHNLKGLYYIDSATVKKEEYTLEKKKTKIDSLICCFIQSITFDNDTIYTIAHLDTSMMKKSLQMYSYLSESSYEGWPPPRKLPYLEWSNLDINKNNFNSIFWGMLKIDYNLPQKQLDYTYNLSCEDLTTELLYYSKNVYTVRVKWGLPGMKNKYIAILSLQEKKGEFKIIGFNKARIW